MISAVVQGLTEILVTYSGNVNAAGLTPAEYQTLPSFESGSGIFPQTSSSFLMDFLAPINAEASLSYTGSLPGVKSPDTIALT